MNRKNKKVLFLGNCIKFSLILLGIISCENSSKEINDFLADQNLPIGVAENIDYKYKDSGMIIRKMKSPLLWDFTNKKLNPYSEFPKGVKIIDINRKTKDSITIIGDYAVSYDKTGISEIIGNVVIINHKDEVVLNSDQMYWDKKENYFFTQTPFTIYTETDTLRGVGFESVSNLTSWILNNTKGDFIVDQKK